ncbi:rhodanese-like domain-containing protein, partial [Mycobacterium colombiense]|uniref:rhodanese-like domain-containing protein n=1 Tax=Mycobacterium colombiense TaxID=339268 RepID=UPI0018C88511
MTATVTDAITSVELRKLLESPTAPRVVDVRTPAEFETAHIADSHNVPLDVLENRARRSVPRRAAERGPCSSVVRSGTRA